MTNQMTAGQKIAAKLFEAPADVGWYTQNEVAQMVDEAMASATATISRRCFDLQEVRTQLRNEVDALQDRVASMQIERNMAVGLRTEFARLLGCELTATEDQVAAGLERLMELVRDKERLDWLEHECLDVRWLNTPTGGDDYVATCFILDTSAPKNHKTLGAAHERIRAAIDAAKEGAK